MMTRYALWGVFGLLLGVGVGYGASLTSFMAGGEYFVPNNSEKPNLASRSDNGSGPTVNSEVPRARVHVLNGEKHEFGSMIRDTRKSHTFIFKNVGNAPLALQKGETTCKCTFSELETGEVPPGGTVSVMLEWDGKSSTPMFSQSAEIITNDPERTVVRLSVEGVLEDAVRVLPETVVLSNLPGDVESVRTVRMFSAETDLELEVEEAIFLKEATAKYFTVETRPLDDSELRSGQRVTSALELTIRIHPGLPTGKIDQVLKLRVNSPNRPELEIPIVGNVISDISVIGRGTPYDSQQNLLMIGAVPRAEGAKRELIVMVKGVRREEIELSVDRVDPPEALQAILGEPIVGERLVRYPLTVEVIPGAPPMSRLGNKQGRTGKIHLKATNSDTKELTIFVTFVTN